MKKIDRRDFIRKGACVGVGIFSAPILFNSFKIKDFPVRQLTKGPKQYWFGYYDKLQVDPTGRYVLGMQLQEFFRSPNAQDRLIIGMVDTQDNDRWIELGVSNVMGWQQGCMLQWIPGSKEEVIWNDRVGGEFVSQVVNIKTGRKRTLPKAIYALSPDGKYAIGTEFSRIQNLRPGYGYAGVPDPNQKVKAPDNAGIYKMDLKTGKNELIISLAQMAAIPHQGKNIEDNWHWFNHLLVSPDSQRFIFLHRWRSEITDTQTMAAKGFVTRMFTADKSGKDLFNLDPSGFTSHFVWRDPLHVCAWTKPEGHPSAFYLLKDKVGSFEVVGKDEMVENGHNTYVPNTKNEWILNDTYPYHSKDRNQTLYLYHVPSRRKVILGQFHEPEKYTGEWRCDLHPKCNQSGTQVIFDSTHGGDGRQMYMVDIKDVLTNNKI